LAVGLGTALALGPSTVAVASAGAAPTGASAAAGAPAVGRSSAQLTSGRGALSPAGNLVDGTLLGAGPGGAPGAAFTGDGSGLAGAGSAVGGTSAPAGRAARAATADSQTSEVYPRPASGSWTIDGHGWGHGIGQSQWGTQGAAESGVTSGVAITAHYYPGTDVGALGNPPVRVKISAADPGTLQVAPAAGLTARDAKTSASWPLSGGSAYRVLAAADGLHLQKFAAGVWSSVGTAAVLAGPVDVSSTAPMLRLHFPDGSQRDYRGVLRAVGSGSALTTIAVVPMEDYLRGVVPRESPAYWHDAALQAQAIAARDYAAYEAAHAAAGASYDLCDSDYCQVFGGSNYIAPDGTVTGLESASTDAAVQETAGVIRTVQGAPIFSQFSSSNGGYSVQGSQPYLQATADPWDGVPGEDVHTWTATLAATDLEARYASAGLGTLDSIEVTSRDGNGEWGGRVQTVLLHGHDASGAPTTVSASGEGVYLAHSWPAYQDGLRSSWWKPRAAATPPGPTPPADQGSSVQAPTTLTAGQFLHSPDGRFQAVLQSDGNLVIYGAGRALWATGTQAAGAVLSVQSDGNVVLYDGAGHPLWSTGTAGSGGNQLSLGNDGALTLTGSGGSVWSSQGQGSTLRAPGHLAAGQALRSANGRYQAVLQSDGNFVVYGPGHALWGTRTQAAGASLALQSDGNLVLYDAAGRPRWASGTAGSGSPNALIMQDDGNLVLYAPRGAVWASGS
jgi:SpoIID/LytB domain protein